jgi:hypothetical protein
MNGLKDWLNETLALILNGSLILNGYERGTVAHDSPFNVTVRIPLAIIGPMVIISLVYILLKHRVENAGGHLPKSQEK